jgi:hypothetical protein
MAYNSSVVNNWTGILKTFGFFIILGLIYIITKVIQSNHYNYVMRNSIVVDGKITDLHHTKGGEVLKVELPFNGKTISSTCESSIDDSLKVGDSIRLRVSVYNPIDYTEYVSRIKTDSAEN